jgi:hypothetical protein
MFLKLTSAGFDTLYLALPDASPVDSDQEYVWRDISEADLQQSDNSRVKRSYIRCVQIPSGTASRFP